LIEVARDRARREGVAVELNAGRTTWGSPPTCGTGPNRTVVQHVGDVAGFLGERRITRAGSRVVAADTDWGSLMIHPVTET
jgi:hypothetical protein